MPTAHILNHKHPREREHTRKDKSPLKHLPPETHPAIWLCLLDIPNRTISWEPSVQIPKTTENILLSQHHPLLMFVLFSFLLLDQIIHSATEKKEMRSFLLLGLDKLKKQIFVLRCLVLILLRYGKSMEKVYKCKCPPC